MTIHDSVAELVAIIARLRAPGGCPWDHEQTHESLKPCLVEEVGEFLDALDDGDDAAMAEELGDVLLQIVFHCQIAAETGRFTLQDAARVCCEKMIRRHPHVFGETQIADAAGVLDQWDRIKRDEKKTVAPESVLSGVPRHLPALQRAQKMQKKAAKVGFDWPSIDGVLAKIEEELAEVRGALAGGDDAKVAEEIGDLMFSVVNLSRFREHQAEELLHGTVRKFERRFRHIETALRADGRKPEDCTLAELDALWNQAKTKTA